MVLALPKLAWFAFSGNPFCQTNNTHCAMVSVPEVASKDYVLQEVLGQGASGIIYKAKWIEDKQQHFPSDIAVKVFKGEVTSDGYPQDELEACLKVGTHHSLVSSIAQVNETDGLALIMALIPPHFNNLGLPPTLTTCTRDTFAHGFTLSIEKIEKIIAQITQVFEHMHNQQVFHGDLYAHNTLFDNDANIIFGDFGAASLYHMLNHDIQVSIKMIEQRALKHFIDDLLSICIEEDKSTARYKSLVLQVK